MSHSVLLGSTYKAAVPLRGEPLRPGRHLAVAAATVARSGGRAAFRGEITQTGGQRVRESVSSTPRQSSGWRDCVSRAIRGQREQQVAIFPASHRRGPARG